MQTKDTTIIDWNAVWDRARRWTWRQGTKFIQNSLWAACGHGKLDYVKFVVECRPVIIAADDNKAIRAASQQGHLHVVEYLIDKGADSEEALYAAIRASQMHIIHALIERYPTMLHSDQGMVTRVAAIRGQLKVLKYMESRRVDVDVIMDDDWTNIIVNSMNVFCYLTRKMVCVRCFVAIKNKVLVDFFNDRMFLIVNFIKGTVGDEQKWRDDPYYDSNLGMLILSYID